MSLKKMSVILCTSVALLAACGTKEEPAETKTTATSQISSDAKKAIEESKKRGQAKAEKNKKENQSSREPATSETGRDTTEDVTTEQSVTELPSTEIPVTPAPATEAPTTEALTTEAITTESVSTENPADNVTSADQLQQIMFGDYTEAEKRQAYNAAVANGIIPPGHMDGGTTMQAYQSSINVQQGLE
ncbi:hypothetical protein [Macrococcus bovicus]|uniref:hypothetical protein n=1 Tax=Macrococcus bovicus TaxID=69968 RepID=UPI0025A51D19|nr:hypothetical protein [Macrococcus bovicus]WJP98718.1 hypothetical protein QSV55_05255 [Macrococcus bovicus]